MCESQTKKSSAHASEALAPPQIAQILGQARDTELRRARGFRECRGLDATTLEDLFQDATLALMKSSPTDEAHVLNRLRIELKHRSLNLRRDEGRRHQILTEQAPAILRIEEGRRDADAPDQKLLASHDRLLVKEFMAELTPMERLLFPLIAEGMKFNRIAAAERLPANIVRNACRSIEQKRQRFVLLYQSGRLCGYRAATIDALLTGTTPNADIAARARAHLEACDRCRADVARDGVELTRRLNAIAIASLAPFSIVARAARRRSLVRRGALQGKTYARLLASTTGTKAAIGATVLIAASAGTASIVIQPGRPQPHHSSPRLGPHITRPASDPATPAAVLSDAPGRRMRQRVVRVPPRLVHTRHTLPPPDRDVAATPASDQAGGGPFSP